MQKSLIITIVAGVSLAAIVIVGLKGGLPTETARQVFSGGKPAWDVGYPKNQLNPQLEATLTHDIDGGGSVFLKGTCDSDADGSAVTLDFEYHAKNSSDNNDAESYYETEGSGGFEHVDLPYRFDGGEVLHANSQTNYKNSARVVFAHISPDAKVSPGDALSVGLAAMFGGMQDLQQFLRAHEVAFQLPLGGGTTEIVSIYPQDSSFREFVRACKIDVKSIDDDVAKQQAKQQAAEKAKADEAARAAEAQKQQQAAAEQAAQIAQQHREAVIQICTTGGNKLRVTGMTRMEDVPGSGLIGVYAFGGQTVDASADPAAVAVGSCSIEFTRDGHDIVGKVPLSALDVADTAAMPQTQSSN